MITQSKAASCKACLENSGCLDIGDRLLEDETLSLADTISMLEAHARRKGLEDLSRGKAPSGAKVFHADGKKPPCKQWGSDNGCRFGKYCRYDHTQGPGKLALNTDQQYTPRHRRDPRNTPAHATEAPAATFTAQAPQLQAGPPVVGTYTAHEIPAASFTAQAQAGDFPSAPFRAPFQTNNAETPKVCLVCCEYGHDTDDCNKQRNYSARGEPIRLEETATTEPPIVLVAKSQDQSVTPFWYFTLFAAFLAACVGGAWAAACALGSAGRGVLTPDRKDIKSVIVFIVLLFAVKYVEGRGVNRPRVSAECYLGSSPGPTKNSPSTGYPEYNFEWVADTGSNRFATNDVNDFVPESIRPVNTRVMVGSGFVISPCVGTVMVRSHATKNLIACTNTLLLPDCGKKLMPAHPFLEKGCEMKMNKNHGVTMLDHNGKILMNGTHKDGLYYYNVSSVRLEGHTPLRSFPAQDKKSSVSLFGLPLSGHIRAAGDEFHRKLTEAHHALGHMDFNKIRKLFGLKRGENPDCATCRFSKADFRSFHLGSA